MGILKLHDFTHLTARHGYQIKHCAAVIVLKVHADDDDHDDVDDDGSVAVTESKLECQGSNLAQLLAGMKKVTAGDVAYLHLTKCSST